MTMPDVACFTHCGLPGIDHVPYGMHVCHFYSVRAQLVAALVPYVVAGLRANERRLWVTAPPLPAGEAVQAPPAAWDGPDEAIQAGGFAPRLRLMVRDLGRVERIARSARHLACNFDG